MDPKVQFVLENLQEMVGSEGGSLELLGEDNGVLRVRYTMGHNEECPECVITPEDLLDIFRSSLEIHAPHIRNVELV